MVSLLFGFAADCLQAQLDDLGRNQKSYGDVIGRARRQNLDQMRDRRSRPSEINLAALNVKPHLSVGVDALAGVFPPEGSTPGKNSNRLHEKVVIPSSDNLSGHTHIIAIK